MCSESRLRYQNLIVVSTFRNIKILMPCSFRLKDQLAARNFEKATLTRKFGLSSLIEFLPLNFSTKESKHTKLCDFLQMSFNFKGYDVEKPEKNDIPTRCLKWLLSGYSPCSLSFKYMVCSCS